MAELDRSGLTILGTDECLWLLRPGGVGRLAWVADSRPVMRPVNFALDRDRIVIRTGAGGISAAASSGSAITFEVDSSHNVDHTAWSVIVDGTIRFTDDEAARDLPLQSWAAGDADRFVQLSIEQISGRRIGGGR